MDLKDTIYEVYPEREKAKVRAICMECFEKITTAEEGMYYLEDGVTLHYDCLRDYMDRYRVL